MEMRDNCSIFIDRVWDPSLDTGVIIFFAIVYSIQFICGICGNSAVLFLTLRSQKLQTVQNMFILNLSLADLIVCVFSLPITPITNVYKNWLFGELMCHSLPWMQGTSVFIATFSLSCIALDRYFMIVKPHRRRLPRKYAKYVMLSLWLTSALITLPYSWFMKIVDYEGLCGKFCTESWPSDEIRRSYTLFLFVFQFVIPFAIMFFCYSRIFAQLRERTRAKMKKLNERSLILAASMPIMSTMKKKFSAKVDIVDQCRKKCELMNQTRRNILVLVSMVVVFGVSWFPQNAVSIAIEFSDGGILMHNNTDYSYVVSLITHCTAMVNNAANPVLYGLLNPGFLDLLRKTCSDWKNSFSRLKRLETISSNTTVV